MGMGMVLHMVVLQEFHTDKEALQVYHTMLEEDLEKELNKVVLLESHTEEYHKAVGQVHHN